MFIRGFSLYCYLMTVSTPHLFVHFLSPVVNYSASSKLVWFLVGTMDVKHQTHRHSKGRSASGPMFIRGFPYMVIEWLSPHLFLPILSPVVNYSASSKMVWFFSRHYGGETSNSSVLGWLVGIRPHVYQGFPSIWLFMTFSTLICAFFIARCELFRVE